MSDGLDPLLEALKWVAVAFKDEGVPFALAGGYAAFARGGPQSGHDVDFVIREEDVDAAKEALERRGISTLQPPEDWLFKARHGGEQVDVIFRLAMGPVDDELLGRADQLSVGSVEMPVMSATDVLISKLRAMTEHSCDLAPALTVMRSLREQLDIDSIEESSKGHPFAEAALHVARALGVLPTTGGRR